MNANTGPETKNGYSTAQFTPARLIMDGAQAWHWPPVVILVIVFVPFIIAGMGLFTAILGKETYKWFTGEDNFAETMQVLFYSLALILGLIVMFRQWRRDEKWISFLYLILCVVFVFLIGEELSWGQRLFGWETSESFAAMNKQEETNLHNIYGVGSAFKWAQLLVGLYGSILPLVVLRVQVPARYREMAASVIPHYTLVTYFVLLVVWRIYRNLFEAPKAYSFAISEYNEVLELVLAMGFCLFILFQLRRIGFVKENDRVKMALGESESG